MLISCLFEFNLIHVSHCYKLFLRLLFQVVAEQYSVTFYSEKGFGSVVDYKRDSKTDMFQIGRSTEPLVDFIVVDTIGGPKDNIDEYLSHSTISRFACRINVERTAPNRAKIFAAAFDSHKRIFLGVSEIRMVNWIWF